MANQDPDMDNDNAGEHEWLGTEAEFMHQYPTLMSTGFFETPWAAQFTVPAMAETEKLDHELVLAIIQYDKARQVAAGGREVETVLALLAAEDGAICHFYAGMPVGDAMDELKSYLTDRDEPDTPSIIAGESDTDAGDTPVAQDDGIFDENRLAEMRAAMRRPEFAPMRDHLDPNAVSVISNTEKLQRCAGCLWEDDYEDFQSYNEQLDALWCLTILNREKPFLPSEYNDLLQDLYMGKSSSPWYQPINCTGLSIVPGRTFTMGTARPVSPFIDTNDMFLVESDRETSMAFDAIKRIPHSHLPLIHGAKYMLSPKGSAGKGGKGGKGKGGHKRLRGGLAKNIPKINLGHLITWSLFYQTEFTGEPNEDMARELTLDFWAYQARALTKAWLKYCTARQLLFASIAEVQEPFTINEVTFKPGTQIWDMYRATGLEWLRNDVQARRKYRPDLASAANVPRSVSREPRHLLSPHPARGGGSQRGGGAYRHGSRHSMGSSGGSGGGARTTAGVSTGAGAGAGAGPVRAAGRGRGQPSQAGTSNDRRSSGTGTTTMPPPAGRGQGRGRGRGGAAAAAQVPGLISPEA